MDQQKAATDKVKQYLYKCIQKDKNSYFDQIFDAGFNVNTPIVDPASTSLMICAGMGTAESLQQILKRKPILTL